MEAIPKSDIKSVIKSDIRFDISIKWTMYMYRASKISICCGALLAVHCLCSATIPTGSNPNEMNYK